MLRIKVNYRRNDTSKRLVTLNWKKRKGNGLKMHFMHGCSSNREPIRA